MAKKSTIRNVPRIRIPVDRQTPAQTFAPREQPVTPPPPPQPEAPQEKPQ